MPLYSGNMIGENNGFSNGFIHAFICPSVRPSVRPSIQSVILILIQPFIQEALTEFLLWAGSSLGAGERDMNQSPPCPRLSQSGETESVTSSQ